MNIFLCKKRFLIFLLFCLTLLSYDLLASEDSVEIFEWKELPELPRGLAGQFVGSHNGALIVAGGAYFPVSLFEGGKKVWNNDIYVLEPESTMWKKVAQLDEPIAYGATISTEGGMICIGGGNAEKHFQSVTRLQWIEGKIQKDNLPELPKPCAFCGAAKIGDIIYVVGGQETPNSNQALDIFWKLELSQPDPHWQELEPPPGPARILPVVSAQDQFFYLFSGAELIKTNEGTVTRRYRTDAYSYHPEQGWRDIASIPKPVVAAPAIAYGSFHIFIFGGDDGLLFAKAWELKEDHPGFSHDIFAYHTITDTWTKIGTLPVSYVTTSATLYQDRIVIAGGEDRPGHRGTKVISGFPQKFESNFAALDYVAIFIYFLILIYMGFYFARREKSTDDFFIAGRRIPWWAVGISIFGTQLSAITFLAVPAKAFAEDWIYFLVNMTIIMVAPIVIYFYLPFFRKLNITSAYEYLEKRFNVAVRLFGSMAFLLFQIGRIGIVLFLPAIVLSTATGINIYVCILLMGILATAYTALGGIEAVIWTDVLQVIVLAGGALFSFIIITFNVDGGFAGIISEGVANNKFFMFNWTWDVTVEAVWIVIIGNIFANAIPYTSDQTVIQRYLTTPTQKEAARAIWTNAALTLPASILFFGLGTALFVFYKSHPTLLDPAIQTDAIFPLFIIQKLPAGIAGIVVAGIFAASMSSLDSSLNSMATVIITDYYLRFKKTRKEMNNLNLARWLTVLFGFFGTGFALLLATFNVSSLLDAFREILGLFGGSLAGLFALGIMTRRATGIGAMVGAIASAVILWLIKSYTDIHFFLYAAIGTVSCFLIGYLASLFFKDQKGNLIDLTWRSRT